MTRKLADKLSEIAKRAAGFAFVLFAVLANSSNIYCSRGELFRKELSVTNNSYPSVQVEVTDGVNVSPTESGNLFIPPATEAYTYDEDGNLKNDGLWNYTWDAENRLISVESVTSGTTNVPVPGRAKAEFAYDYRNRLISLKSYNWTTGWNLTNNTLLIYDDRNLLAQLNATNKAPVRSYAWGLDLSGSVNEAGGIGGLLIERDHGSGVYNCPAYDGNGNVTALVSASDQSVSAQYEYSPFGEVIRATGPMAKVNPFLFSTKYYDWETELLMYPARPYSPRLGRWLSRDPMGEDGGNNLYAFLKNNPINDYDPLGMDGTLAEEEAAGGIASGLGEGIAQGMSIYMRVKNAVDTFNTVQEFGTMMMDADPDNADEMLMAVAQLGAQMLVEGLVKKRVAMIGNVDKLDPYRGKAGVDIFGGWDKSATYMANLRTNVRWLQGVVKSGKDVIVAPGSVGGKQLLDGTWRETVTSKEIKYLLKRGYKMVDGNRLVKTR